MINQLRGASRSFVLVVDAAPEYRQRLITA